MVRADAAGNTYITGGANNTIDWGGTQTTMTGGNDGYYLASYDANHALRWIKYSDGVGYDEGYNLAVGNNGRVYSAGNFLSNQAFFGFSIVNGASVVGMNTSDGTPIFGRDFPTIFDQNRNQAVAVDDSGYVYTAGFSSGYLNPFVAKVDGLTGASKFVTSFGLPSTKTVPGDLIVANGRVFLSTQIDANTVGQVAINNGPNLLEISTRN